MLAVAGVNLGDLPTWIGAIIASLALVSAARSLRQGYRAQQRAQASQVHVLLDYRWLGDPTATSWLVHVTLLNTSDAPIYDVWLTAPSPVIREPPFECFQYVPPGESRKLAATVALTKPANEIDANDRPLANASFRDANGYSWQRWVTGDLKPPIDARRRSGWRKIIWALVPDSLLRRWIARDNRPPLRTIKAK